MKKIQLIVKVSKTFFKQRLDHVLAKLYPNYSRSRIKHWILDKKVTVNGIINEKPNKKILGGEKVFINTSIEEHNPMKQNIFLNVLYEDKYFLIINKPDNLVMHPGAGNLNGTMLNGLLNYYPPIKDVPRAGIVHRLDKNTTGLIVVAKNVFAQEYLITAFKNRQIYREYEALVFGKVKKNGKVDKPIGRNFKKRIRMSVQQSGKSAITYYYVIRHYDYYTHLKLILHTGRTHQIRVHMEHIGHPIVGDPTYNKNTPLGNVIKKRYSKKYPFLHRQALHSKILSFIHPVSKKRITYHAEFPKDMKSLIE